MGRFIVRLTDEIEQNATMTIEAGSFAAGEHWVLFHEGPHIGSEQVAAFPTNVVVCITKEDVAQSENVEASAVPED